MSTDSERPGALTKADALKLAASAIEQAMGSHHNMVVLPDQVVERDFGWVVYYATQAFLESRNPGDMVPGAAPVVVDRNDGSTTFLDSSMPPEQGMQEYERQWRQR